MALSEGVEEAKWMLLPHDAADDRDAILEIRAGTGGDEASLFAGDLVRMYLKHADEKGVEPSRLRPAKEPWEASSKRCCG